MHANEKEPQNEAPNSEAELARLADEGDIGILRELLAFVRQENRWFLIPILVVLLLAGLFAFLSSTAAAPFIYALF